MWCKNTKISILGSESVFHPIKMYKFTWIENAFYDSIQLEGNGSGNSLTRWLIRVLKQKGWNRVDSLKIMLPVSSFE